MERSSCLRRGWPLEGVNPGSHPDPAQLCPQACEFVPAAVAPLFPALRSALCENCGRVLRTFFSELCSPLSASSAPGRQEQTSREGWEANERQKFSEKALRNVDFIPDPCQPVFAAQMLNSLARHKCMIFLPDRVLADRYICKPYR